MGLLITAPGASSKPVCSVLAGCSPAVSSEVYLSPGSARVAWVCFSKENYLVLIYFFFLFFCNLNQKMWGRKLQHIAHIIYSVSLCAHTCDVCITYVTHACMWVCLSTHIENVLPLEFFAPPSPLSPLWP